jgi:hypothetical protein
LWKLSAEQAGITLRIKDAVQIMSLKHGAEQGQVGMTLRMRICAVKAMWFKPDAGQLDGMMPQVLLCAAKTMLLKPNAEQQAGMMLLIRLCAARAM